MTFNPLGFKTIEYIGSLAGAAGTNLSKHAYITADDEATVETSGYFNALTGRLKAGDQIDVTLGIGGTMGRVNYFVATNTAGVVTIGREGSGIGGGLTTLVFALTLADIAAGDVLTDYVPGYPFKIESVDFRVAKPATTAAKAATLNLEIGTTNLTGGVVALTSAAATPAGAAIAGSAVTANNVGTATDAFSIEAASVTAFVEGSGWLLVKLRNLDG